MYYICIRNQTNPNFNTFNFLYTKKTYTRTYTKKKKIEKKTCPHKTPPKIIKHLANIIDLHFTNIIHKDIDNCFSENAKIASFKKKEREKVEYCRRFSIFSCFFKIYEKYIH